MSQKLNEGPETIVSPANEPQPSVAGPISPATTLAAALPADAAKAAPPPVAAPGTRPAGGLDVSALAALLEGRHADPFAVLGPHAAGTGTLIRTLQPGATRIEIVDMTGRRIGELQRIDPAGLFAGSITGTVREYRLRITDGGGLRDIEDVYRFGPVLGEMDDYLMGEGTHRRLWEKLGSHTLTHEGISGVHFAVWAPTASRVSVVGDFNGWDGRRHPMRKRTTGVWELFVPGLMKGALYKYELLDAAGRLLPQKSDPMAQGSEYRPSTASRVAGLEHFAWSDAAWMARRAAAQTIGAPISIYEAHLGSWQRREDGGFLSYDEIADRMIPYVKDLGFTHIELMPISEYPFDGSWGYQPVGLFATTARHGTPEGFARFVDRCHVEGLGVMIDWVAGHFPTDPHGLGRFDGTALYEHEDPRLGFHPDWNTLVFNYGRAEVANFLHANALFWYEKFHLDGLRVDAVASMLYLDYSRKAGEWLPNRHGGRENLEAVDFLRLMNELTYAADPSIMSVAEESTAWAGVSRPTWTGGLGFGFKWNMGWMNDSLAYMSHDPIHRRYHHHEMTFSMHYAYSENFILPLSHDEVVHGKGSILARMPGDPWQQFANLRAYYGFMWGHPGKKLLFMGQEFAQGAEWNHDEQLHWWQDQLPQHAGIRALVRDLNHLYRELPALHTLDCAPEGFEWIEANDADHSVFVWLRRGSGGARPVVCVSNFTPVPHENYRIGLPAPGLWRERLNTDAAVYGGANMGNAGGLTAENVSWHGREYSAPFTIPPLATVFFEYAG